MIRPATVLPTPAEIYSNEFRSLLEQLGSPEDEFAFTGAFPELECVNSVPALRAFLTDYHDRILLPLELPAICRAYNHTSHNECRELIQFDRTLDREPQLRKFASASKRVGHVHLRRFRPMRERFVQRYLQAVDSDEAHGWHTLVFGMSLSVYSLPLRQGLNFYAAQVLRGFAFAAARLHRLPHGDCREIVEELAQECSIAIEKFFMRETALHVHL